MKQEGIWCRRKLSIKGEWIKHSSQLKAEASERTGRQPALREGEFLSWSRVWWENSGGPKTQRCVVGRRLSVRVFVFGSLCLCVWRHCLWSRSLLVHRSLLSILTYSPSPLLLWPALNSYSLQEFQWTGEWLWGQLMSPGQGYTLVDSEGPTISEPQ